MTLVVTGATGFLGGALVRAFRQQGLEVLASGRDALRAQLLVDHGAQIVLGELSNPEVCRQLCLGAQSLVHCAALSSPWGKRVEFERCNLQASKTLFAAAQKSGVRRFVHVSTPSLYMGSGDRLNVHEDAALPKPMNEYIRTKGQAEKALVKMAEQGNTELVVLRPRALYGPGDRAIFPRLIQALRERRLPQIGGGQNIVDLTHISDAVQAVSCALQAPLIEQGRCYNVTSGRPALLWSLIRSLCQRLDLALPWGPVPRHIAHVAGGALEWGYRLSRTGHEPPLTRYLVEVLSRSMTLDISRAQQELGYVPLVEPEAGLLDFVERMPDREV